MNSSELALKNRAASVDILRGHNARNPWLFGSCSRNEELPYSDMNILTDPIDSTTLLDIVAIRPKLLALPGIPVDVVIPGALSESFRTTLMAQAKPP